MSVKARWLLLLAMVVGARAAVAEDAPKKYPVVIQGHKAMVWASSTLAGPPGDPDRYCAKNAFDGDLKTAWVEGSSGGGFGEKVYVSFAEPVALTGIAFNPGYLRSFKTLTENMMPSMVRVMIGSTWAQVPVFYGWQLDPARRDHAQLPPKPRDSPSNMGPRVLIFSKPLETNEVELGVDATIWHVGQKYEDSAVSEWTPILSHSSNWATEPGTRRAIAFLGAYARGEPIDSSNWVGRGSEIADPASPFIDDSDSTKSQVLSKHLRPAAAGDPLHRFLEATRDIFLSGKFGGAPLLNAAVWSEGGKTYAAAMPVRIAPSKEDDFGVAPYFVFDHEGMIIRAGFRITTGKSRRSYHDPLNDALPDLEGL